MITETTILNSRYRLDKKIGQGGFAEVYLSTDLLLERRVAVKVLNSELTGDESFLERFGKEAKAVAALDHPNILSIHDYGQSQETAYLVMPYVEGGALHDKLRRGSRLSLTQTASYLTQVASALDYAHRRNIVHRDVKPQNMLLRSDDDRLLLADFGIAKVLDSAASQGRTGVMGTLSYMAPEQINGRVGIATDIYALGCVLFQMLTGQLPFAGPTEQVLMGHLQAPIPSIIERSQGQVPASVQPVIEKALAKRPEDRYSSAGQMAKAFMAALDPQEPTVGLGFISPASIATAAFQPPSIPAMPTYIPSVQVPPVHVPLAQAIPVYVPPNYQAQSPVYLPPLPDPGIAPTGKPNRVLLAGILAGGLVLLIIAVTLLVILSGQNNNRGVADNQSPVALATSSNLAANTATGPVTTAINSPTPAPATSAPISVATSVVTLVSTPVATVPQATLPAKIPPPATTEALAATTPAAPTSAPSPTLVPATIAPATVAPNTVAPATTRPPITAAFDKTLFSNSLLTLPGTTSSLIILPDGQLVEDDADRRLPSASTIKLWIAAAFYVESSAGRLNPADNYTVKSGDIASGTGILRDNVGKVYTYDKLISTMLIYSDNSAANIIIEKLGGMGKVNAYAQRYGYNQTLLQRKLGDVSNPNNNFTCARDAAVYVQRLLKGEIVDKASSDRILAALRERRGYRQDQNFFGTRLPGEVDYLHISGTGTLIRNEIGYISVRSGKPLIIVMLVADTAEAGAETAIATAIAQIYNLAFNI